MRSIQIPRLGHSIKLSRKRPDPNTPKLHLSKYLRNLPAPPSTCNYEPNAMQALSQMYLNDQLGDCVIAAGYHIVGVETGNANGGSPYIATQDQITADYSAIAGYVPGDPNTDQGCDEPTALKYWTNKGFSNGTKLSAWVAIDATNKTEVQQAMYLFENLFFGLELPDSWISPFPNVNGFTWDVGTPNPNNGHAFCGTGYSAQGVYIDTWGLIGTITYAAIAQLCVESSGGELYVLLTADQIAKGQTKAPNGIAWADLVNDFNALGGNVPVPTPVPTPPAPVPVTPTLSHMNIAPTNASANVGSSVTFKATGVYSDGSTADVTSSCTWSSNNKAVATVSSSVAHGVSAGSAEIIAVLSGVTISTNLTVKAIAPVPAPPPAPPPAPTPIHTITLQQAQTWVTAGLAQHWPHGNSVTLAQASAWATTGLQSNWPQGSTTPTLAQAEAWAVQGLQSSWPTSHR